MRLHRFISANMETILQAWENFARANQPADADLKKKELRDHARDLLEHIVRDMTRAQVESQRTIHPAGESPGPSSDSDPDTPAQAHADERLDAGFPVRLLVAEYRALRASVLRLWFSDEAFGKNGRQEDMEDLIRFNEGIDRALADSVERYADAVIENSGIFIGMLGHDLRSPLQVLSFGATKLKKMEDAGAPVNPLGPVMLASVKRMKLMLDNLMDFAESRIGGGLRLNLDEADLAVLALELVEEFRSVHLDHDFQLQVSGNCIGRWDAVRIGQVCQNLISNAVQHGAAEGEIVMLCEGSEDSVTLKVKSDGEPIPEARHKEIFEISNRNHTNQANQANRNRNLGLGLYIVKELVTAHKGEIHLERSAVAGNSFMIVLPKALAR